LKVITRDIFIICIVAWVASSFNNKEVDAARRMILQ